MGDSCFGLYGLCGSVRSCGQQVFWLSRGRLRAVPGKESGGHAGMSIWRLL